MIELLWIRDVERRPVKRPVALLSATSAKIVADWRRRNPTFDNVPLSWFGTAEDMGGLGDVFNDQPRNNVPDRCENAPPAAVDQFVALRAAFPLVDPRERSWDLYRAACSSVALECAPLGEPVWVIGADADEGILAVVAAHARGGRVAAIASGSIGGIGASVAADLGVNVAVVQHTNEVVL